MEMPFGGAALPDDLAPLLSSIERVVPAGVGKGKTKDPPGTGTIKMPHAPDRCASVQIHGCQTPRGGGQSNSARSDRANHFVELCLDERTIVWIVLHSGSRGVGNKLAQHHITVAKGLI